MRHWTAMDSIWSVLPLRFAPFERRHWKSKTIFFSSYSFDRSHSTNCRGGHEECADVESLQESAAAGNQSRRRHLTNSRLSNAFQKWEKKMCPRAKDDKPLESDSGRRRFLYAKFESLLYQRSFLIKISTFSYTKLSLCFGHPIIEPYNLSRERMRGWPLVCDADVWHQRWRWWWTRRSHKKKL